MALQPPTDWTFGATIPAKDLGTTRKFYEDVLGLEILKEDPAGISYKSGDAIVFLYPTEFAGTAQHTLGGFYVSDIEKAMEQLRSRGVTFEEYDMPGLKTVNGMADLDGEKAAWFKDPEGNILSISETTWE